jgi:hypothetical protein
MEGSRTVSLMSQKLSVDAVSSVDAVLLGSGAVKTSKFETGFDVSV